MKIKLLSAMAAIGMILPVMAMSEGVVSIDVQDNEAIRIYPESGKVDDLNQITLTIEAPNKFGAFVYMPSLYSVNADGSLGTEVSACELMDSPARGKDKLTFRVKNPPVCSGKYAFLIKNNSFSVLQDGDEVSALQCNEYRKSTNMKASGRSFRNFPVNLTADTLRILHISNSYGGNLLYYLSDLLKAADVDVSKVLVERLLYNGGSFRNWVEVSRDENSASYWFYRMAGDLNVNVAGNEGAIKDGSKFRMMLQDNRWNLIVINQASPYAPYHEYWESSGLGGYLPELLEVIRRYQPETPVGMLLIHSYAENYSGNTQRWTTAKRWEKIRDGVEWLKDAYGIDFIVPYGTAIENLRLTGFNNAHYLTGDGLHLAGGLAQYAAGCCYFETVFSRRSGQSVWGNTLRLYEPEVQYADKYEGCVVPVDDAAAETAQKAAFLASRNMFELRNPDYADLSDYHSAEPLNEAECCVIYDLNCFNCTDMVVDVSYCVYGPTGLLIGRNMKEDEWALLPEGLYIRNGVKVYKGK